ncbi:MAG: hypothetical protein RL885_32795 [Planctomycetota bacterium]
MSPSESRGLPRPIALGLQYGLFLSLVLVGGIALAPCFSGRAPLGSAPDDPSAADREELASWSALEDDLGLLLLPSGEGGETAAYDQGVLNRLVSQSEEGSFFRLHLTNFADVGDRTFEIGAGDLRAEIQGDAIVNVDLTPRLAELSPADKLILTGLGAGDGSFTLAPRTSRAVLLFLPKTGGALGIESPVFRLESGEVSLESRRLPRGEIEDYLEHPREAFFAADEAGNIGGGDGDD